MFNRNITVLLSDINLMYNKSKIDIELSTCAFGIYFSFSVRGFFW